jgi:hypothetical protein
MITNTVLKTVEGEEDDLALHTRLCEQRYLQLLDKFDQVDLKFERIDRRLDEIKDILGRDKNDNTALYLKWAGAIIGLLGTFALGLVTHLLLK